MTLQELGSLGEVVGAIATVITLVYLAIQIRANTRAVRTASAQSVHDAFATWYRMLACDARLAQLVMMNLLAAPGGKEFWSERGYLFGTKFRAHIDEDLIKRKPHIKAKPLGAFSIGEASS